MKKGADIVFDSPTFNEFVVDFKKDFRPAYDRLMKKGIVAGMDLGRFYPALSGKYLFCATETVSKEDIDVVVSEVQ